MQNTGYHPSTAFRHPSTFSPKNTKVQEQSRLHFTPAQRLQQTMASNNEDPFEDVLNLEDRFYSEGYQQGVVDGERAGRIEGRSFGIEKGFEKFVEAGRLHGKSIVWANRLVTSPSPSSSSSSSSAQEGMATEQRQTLKVLPGGGRLGKNIITLHALVEPDTLSTENTDDAVQDFDDRVKRAQGKARVIERQIGEDGTTTNTTATVVPSMQQQQQKRENGGTESGSSGATSKTEEQ